MNRIELMQKLIDEKKLLRAKRLSNLIGLSAIQQRVSDVLKPVIDPVERSSRDIVESLKETSEGVKDLQAHNSLKLNPIPIGNPPSQLSGYNPKPKFQDLNLKENIQMKGLLPTGIKPTIEKNPIVFKIGQVHIPFELINGVLILNIENIEDDNKKLDIVIEQDLINLLNGDTPLEKYYIKTKIQYWSLLKYTKYKIKQRPTGNRFNELDGQVRKYLSSKYDEESERYAKEAEQYIDAGHDESDESDESVDQFINEDGTEILKTKPGKGLTVFLPNSLEELFNRLFKLQSAKSEGHNNVDNEIHAILKTLLQKKAINTEDYKKLS